MERVFLVVSEPRHQTKNKESRTRPPEALVLDLLCGCWGYFLPFSGFAISGDKLFQEVFPLVLLSVTMSLLQQLLLSACEALAPNFCFQNNEQREALLNISLTLFFW